MHDVRKHDLLAHLIFHVMQRRGLVNASDRESETVDRTSVKMP